MVWYIPPLSPIQSAANTGRMPHRTLGKSAVIPDVGSLRIPVRYLANLLTAGKEGPIVRALERMLAMRAFMRHDTVHGETDGELLQSVGIDEATVRDMYHVMAIANYEDRFVIPTSHKELVEDSFNDKGSCGFTFGNGCSGGVSETGLFGKKPQGSVIYVDMPKSRRKQANANA
jgi:nitrate reductase beta subunit